MLAVLFEQTIARSELDPITYAFCDSVDDTDVVYVLLNENKNFIIDFLSRFDPHSDHGWKIAMTNDGYIITSHDAGYLCSGCSIRFITNLNQIPSIHKTYILQEGLIGETVENPNCGSLLGICNSPPKFDLFFDSSFEISSLFQNQKVPKLLLRIDGIEYKTSSRMINLEASVYLEFKTFSILIKLVDMNRHMFYYGTCSETRTALIVKKGETYIERVVGRFDIHSTRVNGKVYLTDRNTKAIKHYKLWVKYWEQRNYYYPGSVRDNYSDPWYYEIKRSKRVELR